MPQPDSEPKLIPDIDQGKAEIQNDHQAKQLLWETTMGQALREVRHEKTAVLMLSWHPEDDDLGVEPEVTDVSHSS